MAAGEGLVVVAMYSGFSCGAFIALREGGGKGSMLIHVADSVLGMGWKIVDARSNASFAQWYQFNLPISSFQRGDMRVVARAAQWRIHSIKRSRSNVLVSV